MPRKKRKQTGRKQTKKMIDIINIDVEGGSNEDENKEKEENVINIDDRGGNEDEIKEKEGKVINIDDGGGNEDKIKEKEGKVINIDVEVGVNEEEIKEKERKEEGELEDGELVDGDEVMEKEAALDTEEVISTQKGEEDDESREEPVIVAEDVEADNTKDKSKADNTKDKKKEGGGKIFPFDAMLQQEMFRRGCSLPTDMVPVASGPLLFCMPVSAGKSPPKKPLSERIDTLKYKKNCRNWAQDFCKNKKVKGLRKELKARGLSVIGIKKELQERLEEALADDGSTLGTSVEDGDVEMDVEEIVIKDVKIEVNEHNENELQEPAASVTQKSAPKRSAPSSGEHLDFIPLQTKIIKLGRQTSSQQTATVQEPSVTL